MSVRPRSAGAMGPSTVCTRPRLIAGLASVMAGPTVRRTPRKRQCRVLTSARRQRRMRRPAPTGKGGLMLNPGEKATDFVGRDHTGQTVLLADFKGKTVVLWFYPKADTPG